MDPSASPQTSRYALPTEERRGQGSGRDGSREPSPTGQSSIERQPSSSRRLSTSSSVVSAARDAAQLEKSHSVAPNGTGGARSGNFQMETAAKRCVHVFTRLRAAFTRVFAVCLRMLPLQAWALHSQRA